jgi:hypothetical protein
VRFVNMCACVCVCDTLCARVCVPFIMTHEQRTKTVEDTGTNACQRIIERGTS